MFVDAVLLLKVPVGSVAFLVEQDMSDPSNDDVPFSELSDNLCQHNGRRELPQRLLFAQLGTTRRKSEGKLLT